MDERELPFLSIAAARAALAENLITPVTLTQALADRAAALAGFNIFIELWREAALVRAEELTKGGFDAARPLWGLPMAHKDIFARPGRQPGCGVTKELPEAGLPPSPVLARLEAAGAIDLGPATLAEFAAGITGTNAIFGDVGNPWDPAHCAGASSSGSAAAVAAGLAFASLGTDTGASTRVPASFCGVVGLMPTRGAITNEGCFPLAWSLDTTGILARSIDDCALVFDVARGRAPASVPKSAGLTIGLPKSYYNEGLDADVAQALEAAARTLETAGHRLREVAVIERTEMRALNRALMRPEAAAIHRRLIRERPECYSLAVRNFITGGEGVFALDYIDAQRLRARLLTEALSETYAHVDMLLTPAVFCAAPRYAEISDAADPKVWRRVTMLAQFTQPASLLGLPALSVPYALSGKGMPIGMQLVGAPGSETRLLQAGRALETRFRQLDARPAC